MARQAPAAETQESAAGFGQSASLAVAGLPPRGHDPAIGSRRQTRAVDVTRSLVFPGPKRSDARIIGREPGCTTARARPGSVRRSEALTQDTMPEIVTVMVTMAKRSVVERIRLLGFTDYEARAMLALLVAKADGEGGLTGYRIAKLSGVPRAKIYEVLDSLQMKGVSFTKNGSGQELHYVHDTSEIILRHMNAEVGNLVSLLPDLDRMTSRSRGEDLVVGADDISSAASSLISEAKVRLFVAGTPSYVDQLDCAMARAESRGVQIYALTYGDSSVTSVPVFRKHALSDDVPVDAGTLWLVVVSDNSAALIGRPAPEPSQSAIWTADRTIANLAGEFVRQQIYSTELAKVAEGMGVRLDPSLAFLQRMWFNDPGRRA